MRCYLSLLSHCLPVAELWSGTVLVAGSGLREQAGERVWAPLCPVLAQVWLPAWSSSWGWNGLEVWEGKGPENLKVCHVASTDIWENLSYEMCCTALSPIFSFQQTQRMFMWVLGLLKSSMGGGKLALSQQETGKNLFFYSWE